MICNFFVLTSPRPPSLREYGMTLSGDDSLGYIVLSFLNGELTLRGSPNLY